MPADSATLHVVDAIHTRMGAQDNLALGVLLTSISATQSTINFHRKSCSDPFAMPTAT